MASKREIDAEKLQAEMTAGASLQVLQVVTLKMLLLKSLNMTAEGVPYMMAMALNLYLALLERLLLWLSGGAVEFMRIRNDISFDTFVDAMAKYNYHEAAEKADSFDPEVLRSSSPSKPTTQVGLGMGPLSLQETSGLISR